jgi:hypothetical protein
VSSSEEGKALEITIRIVNSYFLEKMYIDGLIYDFVLIRHPQSTVASIGKSGGNGQTIIRSIQQIRSIRTWNSHMIVVCPPKPKPVLRLSSFDDNDDASMNSAID